MHISKRVLLILVLLALLQGKQCMEHFRVLVPQDQHVRVQLYVLFSQFGHSVLQSTRLVLLFLHVRAHAS